MDQDEVLKRFQSKAAELEKTHIRSQDTVLLLADIVAHCGSRIPQEDLDSLIHIGGTLVKRGDIQLRARAEVAATMKNFHDSAPGNPR